MTIDAWLASGRAVVPGLVACVGGAGATWLVRGLARRFGIVNKPNPIVPQHTKPVAYLGGVGLGTGIACGIAALLACAPGVLEPAGLSLHALWIPAALYLALGVYDDLVALPPARKFLLQGFVAAVAVALGVWSPLSGIEVVDRALSWFWIMTMVNAFNLTDVCDGLLGSISAVMFAIVALAFPGVAPLCVVFVCGCCGFLVFNKPPATIFLGDAGSHLLGALAATLTIAGTRLSGTDAGTKLLVALLLVGVPLFELSFLVAIRARKGIPWWRGSPDHFSLRMQAGGLSRLQTDLIACVVAAALGAAALGAARTGRAGQLAIVTAVLGFAVIATRTLLRWEVKLAPQAHSVGVAPGAPPSQT